MTLIRAEKAHSINGVPGRLQNLHIPPAPWVAGVFANQRWISEPRSFRWYGDAAKMIVQMRFDDNCKNGRMDFAITGTIYVKGRVQGCGCLHDEIAKHFPELAEFIQWHLCSTQEPWGYIGNTVYLAGDRDASGRAKGDPSSWDHGFRFGTVPAVHHVKSDAFFKWVKEGLSKGLGFEVEAIEHKEKKDYGGYKFGPKYSLKGYTDKWYECPFDSEYQAQSFADSLNECVAIPVSWPTAFSEGKARELDKARHVAIWPEATDEELSVPRAELEKALKARLPALMQRFEAAMTGAGFLMAAPIHVKA